MLHVEDLLDDHQEHLLTADHLRAGPRSTPTRSTPLGSCRTGGPSELFIHRDQSGQTRSLIRPQFKDGVLRLTWNCMNSPKITPGLQNSTLSFQIPTSHLSMSQPTIQFSHLAALRPAFHLLPLSPTKTSYHSTPPTNPPITCRRSVASTAAVPAARKNQVASSSTPHKT
ncbi:hypothetical protein CRM22_004326 [Opisthorchis felineus]|uniref:Uncharacterized protein n=1 Tax=Opisthorchis felineus TaxID=147828 RepID=A0A4S2LWQ6_OPIFE|nr:hypothetical protein CRM22_004326 [Opisthorchis felineus]